MPDDPVASTLAEAQRIADALHFACRLPDKTPDFFACGGPAAEAYWNYFTPARITALLAALEAALKHHAPVDRGRVMRCCEGCEATCGATCCHEWPCPTYEAITRELTGKKASDG